MNKVLQSITFLVLILSSGINVSSGTASTHTQPSFEPGLEATGSIPGHAFADASGTVITHALISVHAHGISPGSSALGTHVSRVDGSYTVSGLVPGTYRVQANNNREPGYVTEYYDSTAAWEGADTIEVVPDQTTPGIDFVLDEPQRTFLPLIHKTCPSFEMLDGSWEVQAEPSKGFSWPYYLYVPRNVSSTHGLVVPNNSGQRSDDFCFHRERAYELVRGFASWADKLGSPLVVPIFPRFRDTTDGSQYLGRSILEEYWRQIYPAVYREDLQLIAMIDDARARLEPTRMDSRVLLWGYSASGMSVSRFVVLHPDRVQAAAIGGHGWTTSPVADWQGLALPYPYGTGDLIDLIGGSTDLVEFQDVPLYVYMGAEDSNSWALPWYVGMEESREEYFELFKAKFGTSPSSLLSSAQTVFDSLHCSATFKLYSGAGHLITQEMREDAYRFLYDHR